MYDDWLCIDIDSLVILVCQTIVCDLHCDKKSMDLLETHLSKEFQG